jgi:hypothetical protein
LHRPIEPARILGKWLLVSRKTGWGALLTGRGSHRLPQCRRQPPPEGAQAAPEALAEELALAKVENCCWTFLAPQCGQAGGSWFRPRTSFSKVLPHLEQVYSKMGIPIPVYSLALGSQALCWASPDRAPIRGAHVNLEIPGMRGAIKYQKMTNPAMRARGR